MGQRVQPIRWEQSLRLTLNGVHNAENHFLSDLQKKLGFHFKTRSKNVGAPIQRGGGGKSKSGGYFSIGGGAKSTGVPPLGKARASVSAGDFLLRGIRPPPRKM